jgi:2-polyprenyl-3-methyl-5-hydroxy-6-metoxy-1,4-benzoquinol methylase
VGYIHPKAAGVVGEQSEHDAYLDVAEENAPNYLRWIADLCRPHLGARVLDVGAGTGAITAHYADGREIVAVEMSEWCIEALRRRFGTAPNVTVRHADLLQLPNEEEGFDSVVMINVLEHIENDAAALSVLSRVLNPGGRIVVYVPAFNGLYGAYDRKVGHCRRYARWRMLEVLNAANLEALSLRYVNALAIPAWLAFSRTNIERRPAGRLAVWDRTGVPLTRFIESHLQLPFGLNLFCVAQLSAGSSLRN